MGMPDDTVQKWWTNRFTIWFMYSDGPKEAQIQSYLPVAPMCYVPSLEGMYIRATWQMRFNHLSAAAMWPFVSHYFDHLLLFWANSVKC